MSENERPVNEAVYTEHEHTHTHRHHSRAYYKYRIKKHKAKKFIKKRKPLLLLIAVLILTAAVLTAVGMRTHRIKQAAIVEGTTVATQATYEYAQIGIEVPYFDEPHIITPDFVKDYMSDKKTAPLSEYLNSHQFPSNARLDAGNPFVFHYAMSKLPSDLSVKAATLALSEEPSLENAASFTFAQRDNTLKVYNLKASAHYFYRLSVLLSSGAEMTATGEFDTAHTPRLLHIDGAANVRDIGGWSVKGGKRIKQGMVLRGSELDGKVEPLYKLTESGREQLHGQFHIRLDADLRSESEGLMKNSPIDRSVTHKVYGLEGYVLFRNDGTNPPMKALFQDLAKAENYPVYLHCTHGTDRTGTVCFVLEALLGCSEEQLLREYDLSALFHHSLNTYGSDAKIQSFKTEFNKMTGDTTQAKAETYLRSLGITQEEMDSIRNILLED